MSLLKELAGHPEYVALINKAKAQRPTPPPWSRDSVSGLDNTDDWKEQSAMQKGFDLCFQLFVPK